MADIFDLRSTARLSDLANRKPDVDTAIWWARLNTGLPPPVHRQYSMDRGGPGIMGGGDVTGGGSIATLPPVCRIPGCDSILVIGEVNICRQCKLEGLGL